MSDPVKPALTPEQWSAGGYHSKDIAVSRWRPALDGSPRLDVAVHTHPLGSGVMGDPSDLHALAALALYGQPFGFTQEDVAALRDAAEVVIDFGFEHGGADAEDEAHATRLRSLADRIAALLPPEEPS